MKTILIAAVSALALQGFGLGAESGEAASAAASPVNYKVAVHEFEGCQCDSVCPCVFSLDTSHGDCRAIMVFTFNGTYGNTPLKDVSCVGVITKAGKNMEATKGKWSGTLYLPQDATEDERSAVKALGHKIIGDAFAELREETAPIEIKRDGEKHDLTMGKLARLRIHPIQAANGKTAQIINAPSPLAFPVMNCAIADVNSYDDGKVSWSFTGRNAFFSDFELSSGQ